jgi:hypothetical protein
MVPLTEYGTAYLDRRVHDLEEPAQRPEAEQQDHPRGRGHLDHRSEARVVARREILREVERRVRLRAVVLFDLHECANSTFLSHVARCMLRVARCTPHVARDTLHTVRCPPSVAPLHGACCTLQSSHCAALRSATELNRTHRREAYRARLAHPRAAQPLCLPYRCGLTPQWTHCALAAVPVEPTRYSRKCHAVNTRYMLPRTLRTVQCVLCEPNPYNTCAIKRLRIVR